jgi:hypothetical protein
VIKSFSFVVFLCVVGWVCWLRFGRGRAIGVGEWRDDGRAEATSCFVAVLIIFIYEFTGLLFFY